jgi:hypothetical protein
MPSQYFSSFPLRLKVANQDLLAACPQAIFVMPVLSSVSLPSGKGSLIERFFEEAIGKVSCANQANLFVALSI